jgi:flagellum-specific peptidoglycan hydrolase FlgJ
MRKMLGFGRPQTLPQRASNLIHRWRRPILHTAACAAVVVSGVIGASLPRSRLSVDLHRAAEAPASIDASQAAEAAAVTTQAFEDGAAQVVGLPVSANLTDPTTPAASTEPNANAAAPALPDALVAVRSYVVEPGDTVRTIAQQFGVTNETIIWENDLTDPDTLEVGQELHILPFSGLIHEVRPGDTVASVANSYEAPINEVISANALSEPYIIVVGQKLAVPDGYRPLPKKVVVAPDAAPDTVQAPPDDDDQVAAVAPPPRHKLPVLGSTPQEQFISSIAEAAVDSANSTGVPASVTIAQAILESYWGSSRLAREANNYFGIKAQTRNGNAGSILFDVWEVIGGRNVMESQAFRAYTSVAESFVDHGRFFLENGRYATAMAARDDPRQFAREVNRAGYATDPAYANKLIGLMDRYDLYRYDDV